ncbi:DNA-binding protein [Bradyrhizobium sp.]|uniref:DNA-binding protein n=1 Tax=Bradyrhizobium sp. TaxID=376 RepID=UPI003C680611
MNPELQELLSKPTASVPDVGRVCFGLCRGASYEAANRGDFPTIRVGRLLKVPTAPLRRQLGLEAASVA